ncbi:AlpA family transcriptional regulator [Pseudomonas sp. GD03817]|uniref:helix-turn-helix transcriptional regulator n=1 Tax=Pseudomonas TaxID=286 RepID=UPI0003653F7D|nr:MULTISPECIES: AlpA family transcriptional regulator [Pseudomonas]ANC79618.1 AlpA family transcriptional regulator [Pseudomonas putida B6-2]MBI6918592.1 AlpA family transcriptional regulator [Pseudomonas monteilii]MCE0937424.1 AlpA family transcriptional regulator [Pseudomonas kurunegalensis]MDH1404399.1 AlpA family transcriptional regulator [Pseudomonas sp. GD03730]MDH1776876.1 AlpA family transcriptional regulator [Pseudomonas sp. GD03817]
MVSAENDRFMRIAEVTRITALSRNTIYKRMREGTFPKQVRLGPNSVAWLQSDISAWMTSVMPDKSEAS